jgi:Family of unknown function (DUF6886)
VPEITCIGPLPTILFHVSEDGEIERFQPRDIEGTSERLVWADRLRNYVVPRECPTRDVLQRSLSPLTNECRSDKRGQGAPDVLDWAPKWAYTALLGSDFRRLICEGETHGFETA